MVIFGIFILICLFWYLWCCCCCRFMFYCKYIQFQILFFFFGCEIWLCLLAKNWFLIISFCFFFLKSCTRCKYQFCWLCMKKYKVQSLVFGCFFGWIFLLLPADRPFFFSSQHRKDTLENLATLVGRDANSLVERILVGDQKKWWAKDKEFFWWSWVGWLLRKGRSDLFCWIFKKNIVLCGVDFFVLFISAEEWIFWWERDKFAS